MKTCEILAPCKDLDVLKAAIDANCDAVYLSGVKYGARSYIKNFTNEELITAINYAHLYGVLVYVTVNTLIFENEIQDCLEYIDFLYLNNVDAIIIQDIGLASICKQRYPDLNLHASTQLNAQTLNDCLVLKKLGFSRIVMGREVSLEVIKEIKKQIDIEIEVFVHGALCYSYSGNCYMSFFNGKRSGNRGECAQPCRLKYKLNNISKYHLSTKDLQTIEYIEKIASVVDSIKIEGRVKSKEYVYTVVKGYSDVINKNNVNIDKLKEQFKIVFNREFTKGFILNETLITNTASSNHIGLLIGKVIKSQNKKTTIKLDHELKYDDCIRIVSKNKCDAIIINEIEVNNEYTKLARSNQIITIRTHFDLNPNDLVYLTKTSIKQEPKHIYIVGYATYSNNLFTFKITDGVNEITKQIQANDSLKDQKEIIYNQLNKTQDTIYRFKELNVMNSCFLKMSELNNLRRTILEELNCLRMTRKSRNINYQLNYPIYEVTDTYDELIYPTDTPRIINTTYNVTGISNSLGHLTEISGVYLNVVNSYSIKVLESLNVKLIGLSIELNDNQIEDIMKSYFNLYQRYPNVYLLVYGHVDLMVSKNCLLKKEFGKCVDCFNKPYYLDNYIVTSDCLCNQIIKSKEPINKLDNLLKYKKMGINHFLIDKKF